MKADAQTEAEVLATLNAAMEAYERREMDVLLDYLAPDLDVIQFGMSAANAKRVGREELKAEFESDWAASEAASCDIGWHSVSVAGSAAWVAAEALFHWKEADEPEETIQARLTVVFEKREGRWLWMHSHFSIPIED
jgi:ketosteroid isomerase-like protein